MSDKQHGGFLGGLRDIAEHVAVESGFAREVPDPQPEGDVPERDAPPTQPVVSFSQPSVPGTIAPTTGAADINLAADVDEQFKQHFPTILQATPAPFQEFLAQRDVLMDSLRESVDPDKLEAAAMKGALGVAKLTSKDVAAATKAASAAILKMRGEFNSDLTQKRREQIDAPTQKIQDARHQIDTLDSQIAELQRKKIALDDGIEPQQREIAAADANLKYVASVLNTTCGRMEEAIAVMERQLSNRTGGRK